MAPIGKDTLDAGDALAAANQLRPRPVRGFSFGLLKFLKFPLVLFIII